MLVGVQAPRLRIEGAVAVVEGLLSMSTRGDWRGPSESLQYSHLIGPAGIFRSDLLVSLASWAGVVVVERFPCRASRDL